MTTYTVASDAFIYRALCGMDNNLLGAQVDMTDLITEVTSIQTNN